MANGTGTGRQNSQCLAIDPGAGNVHHGD